MKDAKDMIKQLDWLDQLKQIKESLEKKEVNINQQKSPEEAQLNGKRNNQ